MRVAELVRGRTMARWRRNSPHKCHADLRTEARPKAKRVLDRVAAALREVQGPELWVGLLEVRDGRDEPGLERLHGKDVLDSRAHRMPREALGVCYHDLLCRLAEDPMQRLDFGRGAPTTRWCVGLV